MNDADEVVEPIEGYAPAMAESSTDEVVDVVFIEHEGESTREVAGGESEGVPPLGSIEPTAEVQEVWLPDAGAASSPSSDVVRTPGLTDDLPEIADDGRSILYVAPSALAANVRRAAACLSLTQRHFQRGGSVTVIKMDSADGPVASELHPLALLYDLDKVSVWKRFSPRSGAWKPIDPPMKICNMMSKAGKLDPLPVLSGIVRQPYLRHDQSVCMLPGYDPASGLYGVFDASEFFVPDYPTREEASKALELLDGLLKEFDFVEPHDRSAALSAMLTAAVRCGLPLAPMFHVRAPQIASGKSYLCQFITALATPRPGTPVGFPGGDDECTKLLLAQLLKSPAVIEFDNLTSDLVPYRSLCTALTSERLEGRILGKSKVAGVQTQTLFLSSGNNFGPVADMARRCLTIRLDPGCDLPAARRFSNPDLVAQVRQNRGIYVSAALTIVRAWIVAGRPQSPCSPLANYAEWGAFCRQPLLWLGRPDPAAEIFNTMAHDPERLMLGQLLCEWDKHFASAPVMVRQVAARAASPGGSELAEVLQEVAGTGGKINNRKLGRWLAHQVGRVVEGQRLVRSPRTRNVENFRVESVASVKSV